MFVWLFIAFWGAEHSGPWFVTSPAVRGVSAGGMLVAFWFLAAALVHRPPVLLTAEQALARPDAITGVLRITRHPLLWAVVLWSAIHMLNNADPAGLSLFGYFLVLAGLGTLPVDRRRARLIEPSRWQKILEETSNIPFAAVFQGRQSFALAIKETGWPVFVTALAAWSFVISFHENFFGLPVFY